MTGFAAALWEDGGTGVGPLRMLGGVLGAPPFSIRARALGAAAHIALGVVVAPAGYGLLFHSIGRADALVGLTIGLVHATLAGAAFPLLFARSGCPAGPTPGFFAHRWGATVPLGIVFSHAIYGTILGYIYV